MHHPTEGPTAVPPETLAAAAAPSDADLAAEIATLRDAIATRTIIGQATGLLAGQLNLSTVTAWRVMRRLSNETNIKLRDIARALVDAHDGRRNTGDAEIARAIGSALGPALAAAREETGDENGGPPDGPHDCGPRTGAASREGAPGRHDIPDDRCRSDGVTLLDGHDGADGAMEGLRLQP